MGIKRRVKKWIEGIIVNKVKQSSPIVSELIDNPQNLKFEGYIVDGNRISITITIRESD